MDLMDLQKTKILILPYHFSNLEVRNYYQNGPRFNGCYSRNNLPFKVKDWAYVTNLDGYVHIGPHWIVLHALGYNGTCFVLESSIFQKELEKSPMDLWSMHLQSRQIFLEHKHMI